MYRILKFNNFTTIKHIQFIGKTNSCTNVYVLYVLYQSLIPLFSVPGMYGLGLYYLIMELEIGPNCIGLHFL